MSPDAKFRTRDLGQVRIPAEFHACLDRVLASLKLRILEGAADQALASGSHAITQADLVRSGRVVLPLAASELEQALEKCGPHYVRSAS